MMDNFKKGNIMNKEELVQFLQENMKINIDEREDISDYSHGDYRPSKTVTISISIGDVIITKESFTT